MSTYLKDESPLTQRVIGAKVHGIGTYAFTGDNTFPKEANQIIEILRRLLNDLEPKINYEAQILFITPN